MVQAHMDEFRHTGISLIVNVICKILNDYIMLHSVLLGNLHICRFTFLHATLNSSIYLQFNFHSSEPYLCIQYILCKLSSVMLSHTLK